MLRLNLLVIFPTIVCLIAVTFFRLYQFWTDEIDYSQLVFEDWLLAHLSLFMVPALFVWQIVPLFYFEICNEIVRFVSDIFSSCLNKNNSFKQISMGRNFNIFSLRPRLFFQNLYRRSYKLPSKFTGKTSLQNNVTLTVFLFRNALLYNQVLLFTITVGNP